jgi:type I restriction enzyme R subunit
MLDEAGSGAEHIYPKLRESGWVVIEGSCILREYPIVLVRIEGHGRRGKKVVPRKESFVG